MRILSCRPISLLLVAVEGRAGQPDHDDHHADVDDVAAVAARVAAGQQPDADEQIPAGLSGDDGGAAQELGKMAVKTAADIAKATSA